MRLYSTRRTCRSVGHFGLTTPSLAATPNQTLLLPKIAGSTLAVLATMPQIFVLFGLVVPEKTPADHIWPLSPNPACNLFVSPLFS